jgi:tetratricopeptide (TPR) repeat protein
VAEAEGIGAAISPDEGDENNAEGGSVDAVGMALALDAAHHDPLLGPAVRRYLNRQRALVDLQIKHFDAEHTLAIAAARRKGFIDRMRICLQVFVAAIIGGLILAVALMLWDAVNDRGVVIDAISVPEDLARQGFTGEVIAKRILDRLAEINNTTGTLRAANSYSNSLGGGIKLEIPETGISIGELSRMLHEKLGHTTHVGGEITHSGDNVTVRIRLGDEYEADSTGPEATLPALVQDASTRIYGRTQPYRYGYWLYQARNSSAASAAAVAFQQLAATGPRTERVWALHGLALVAPSPEDAIRRDQEALQLDPNFILAHLTEVQENLIEGHDEAALKETAAVFGVAPTSNSGLSRRGQAWIRAEAALLHDELLGDFLGMAADSAISADTEDNAGRRVSALLDNAQALILLRDFVAAANILERLPPPETALGEANQSFLKSLSAAQRDDWQSAIPDLEHVRALMSEMLDQPDYMAEFRTKAYPLLAEAYARTGRNTDADTLMGLVPADVYDGWRARGRIATFRRDYAAAEKAFAEAVRQAPSIPRAYLDWGNMLAAKGDLPGAIAKYTEANRLSPHWADPLKAWGDVLNRQGHPREALKKYRQALEHAPRWVELKALVDAGSRT